MIDQTKPPTQVLVLNITQVAQTLGLSRGKVYQLIHHENLPVIPFGRVLRVSSASLQQWLTEREKR